MNDKKAKKSKRDLALQAFFCKVCNLVKDLIEKHPELEGIWNDTKKEVDKKGNDISL